jgi:hypothetical protein
MKKYLIIILLLMFCLVLTSCGGYINGTQLIADQLRPNELIEIYNTTPPNLVERSKCPSPQSIRIVNAETNEKDYIIYKFSSLEAYITPKKLVDDIIWYMNDAFNRTGIKTDQNSTKIIQISMEKLMSWYTMLNYSANTQLKIMLPEKKYSKIYEKTDTTPKSVPMAIAYTIHDITWNVINDPLIQEYILCTNENIKDLSPTRETALDILKNRYANGEITKDQFEQMKKDIE